MTEVGSSATGEPFPALTPPTPPDETAESSTDLQLPSRKREREVSLEPGTPQTPSADLDWTTRKDRRTPAKKNRLDTTEEELQQAEDITEGPHPQTPPSTHAIPHSLPRTPPDEHVDLGLSMSPPHEVKMRQISQRVEHINWKNGAAQLHAEAEASDAGVTVHTAAHEPIEADVEPLVESGSPADIPTPPAAVQEEGEGDKKVFDDDEHMKRRSTDSILSVGGTKRPRDDADKDDNPRETKRPSPPPAPAPETQEPEKKAEEIKSVEAASPKPSGFMAYASFTSPFSSLKGPNLFGAANTKPKSHLSSPSPSPFNLNPNGSPVPSPTPSPFASFASTSSSSSAGTPTNKLAASGSVPGGVKRTGFDAFASATSPFAAAAAAAKRSKSPSIGRSPSPPAARSKSPMGRSPTRGATANVAAFSNYASGGVKSFGSPFAAAAAANRVRTPSPEEAAAGSGAAATCEEEEEVKTQVEGQDEDEGAKAVSFGDRLRAGKDGDEEEEEKKKLDLSEQDLQTGEEDEETLYQVRGKLFVLSPANQWKERGTGMLKLNVGRADGMGARLVMRKEAVYALLLNIQLFKGMSCSLAQDPRYIRFSAFESGKTTHYNLRVSNAKIAEELLDEIQSNLPSA